MDVDLAYLLREEGDVFEDLPLAIVRKDKRKIVKTKGSLYGYQYKSLAYNKPGKNMEAFIISPAFDERIAFQHDGEEFMYGGRKRAKILAVMYSFKKTIYPEK